MSAFFSKEALTTLKQHSIPEHVALIPDGNRRWAKKKGLPVQFGHKKGADNLILITKAAKDLGIKTLSIFGFSTENWSRGEQEVKALMWLLETYLTNNCEEMKKNHIRFETIGNLDPLSDKLKKVIAKTKEKTKDSFQITLILAINYGGRDEIIRAANTFLQKKEENIFPKNQLLNEEILASFLDTASFKDPDLLIRTSGEMRISNFLLWQISYSEVFLTETLWPDFSPDHLYEALLSYQKRERRLGS